MMNEKNENLYFVGVLILAIIVSAFVMLGAFGYIPGWTDIIKNILVGVAAFVVIILCGGLIYDIFLED